MPGAQAEVYRGQFGQFEINEGDRRGVVVYRAALMVAALCFAVATGLAMWLPQALAVQWAIAGLYAVFSIAMGVALWTIHIYMVSLHRALQVFWAMGSVAAIATAVVFAPEPLAIAVYHNPLTLLGVGFTFVALTGLFVKEAFCFNRLETKLLTPMIPTLLLGHLFGLLPLEGERGLLVAWAALFLVFALRKTFQEIPPDIGDKSVFEYLAAVRRGDVPAEAS
ncbi:DUF2301 domain-containing membrane protein [Synechococcus sp. PCC 7336]|uniref:DUF2301 domain-containing membrane protein n=1 Tax=Synechococcus sp. PCC 7336 TaxID=195250 RepID=UPI000374B67E|nr:DUF2301 domain-containing membrane protein [Synechococcus sp. PCC 7336]